MSVMEKIKISVLDIGWHQTGDGMVEVTPRTLLRVWSSGEAAADVQLQTGFYNNPAAEQQQ